MGEPANQKFESTCWSIVISARGEGADAERALGELCQTYWPPLYAFARRSGFSPADAEDFVQGFFAINLKKQIFDSADPDRGKLRTFLLTAFKRHMNDERRKADAQKRGGGAAIVSFDAAEAETWFESPASADESPERAYDRRWALTVLENATLRLRAHFERRGKLADFEAMRPFLTGASTNADYEAIGEQIAMKPSSVMVALHRLRARFAKALREVVADTHGDESDVDEELRYLLLVLRE
ncbi:MAG: RNA polymerase sigma factor (sigma-70 family) [Verrucomicrobiales bacterium]|jgi:RNA polymerase sigma factor (sigma-70 family)